MFYEVRIFNAKGKLKKVLSAKTVSQMYWKNFFINKALEKNPPKIRGRGRKVRDELDWAFDDPCFTWE